jgi:uncharacterized integral membrane protein (TIGR00698 family)
VPTPSPQIPRVPRVPKDLPGLARRWWLPAVLIVAVVLGTKQFAERLKDVITLSPLVIAVVVGILIGNSGILPARAAKDTKTAGKKLLRIGVALLGFRLALGDVADLGPATIACVVAVVLATFFGTQWLAKILGLSKGLGLLLGTGYAICGASAIAAMEPNADAEPEEVAYALSLVTLCGTLSIAVLPPVGRLFNMNPSTFGVFAGAAVHDVAQVVATSSAFSAAAVKTAAVVKLSRVVMLAPMVTLTSMYRRRSQPVDASTVKTPLVPLFVAGFLLAMLLRTADVIPDSWLPRLKSADTLCLAAGMFTLGTGTSLRELKRLGGRPLILGLVSWLLVAGVALVLVLVTQP